ncbi:baseplate assembly protein [Salmonella enterica subsp. houtenae]|nr:baseplate assembly protein [Salmonella enterica subsp. houtenae]
MAVIDLSQLPAPQIVDVPDFETLLAERKPNLLRFIRKMSRKP